VGLIDGHAAQILNQLAGIAITIALAVVGTLVLLKIVDWLIGVRVNEEDEIEGLDLSQHGEGGYSADLDLIPVGSAVKPVQASATGTMVAVAGQHS
jgi:ammonia channel protein AmtB